MTDKTNELVDIATRIKNGENPAGDRGDHTAKNTGAVFGLALPRTVAHVDALISTSPDGYTLPENTPQALLEYYCNSVEQYPFYNVLEKIDVKYAIRRAVLAPDGLGDACGKCSVCLDLASVLDSIAAKDWSTVRDRLSTLPKKSRGNAEAQARKDYQCPPENRNRDNVTQLNILRHASYRVANALLELEKQKFEGVEGDALVDLLRPRAVYFCEERQEAARRAGAMSDWRPGLRAALLALRSGVMFFERSTSEQYNNDPRFIALRVNEGLLQATRGTPLQRA